MTVSEILPRFGNKKKNIADALGLCRSAISRWGERVPARRAAELERILAQREYATAKNYIALAIEKLEEAKGHWDNAISRRK